MIFRRIDPPDLWSSPPIGFLILDFLGEFSWSSWFSWKVFWVFLIFLKWAGVVTMDDPPLVNHIHILRLLGTLIFLQFLLDLNKIWHEDGTWDSSIISERTPRSLCDSTIKALVMYIFLFLFFTSDALGLDDLYSRNVYVACPSLGQFTMMLQILSVPTTTMGCKTSTWSSPRIIHVLPSHLINQNNNSKIDPYFQLYRNQLGR